MPHRLFLGIPLPVEACQTIHEWAEVAYADHSVRLINPEIMHVTLMFFPSVTEEKLAWMTGLVPQIEWKTLLGRTDQTMLLGRSALTLGIVVPKEEKRTLDDRMIRWSYSFPDSAYHDELRKEPMALLSLEQAEPEQTKRRRDHRHHRDLLLHVTFARVKESAEPPLLPMPSIEIPLTKVALYESHLRPEGSHYEIPASSD